jgi:hypothetical protein
MGEYNGGGGGDSEWTVDGNGNLVPKDGEPVSIEQLGSDVEIIKSDATASDIQTRIGSNPSSTFYLMNPTVGAQVSVDLGGAAGLELLGRFTVGATGIGPVFDLHNGEDVTINTFVDGNGEGEFTYADSLATDTTGIDVVFHARGMRGFNVNARVQNYNGRAIETEEEAAGEPKMSLCKFDGWYSADQFGHFEGSTAWGEIDSVYSSVAHGFVHHANDVTVTRYGNIMADTAEPITFDGLGKINIGRMTVGGGASLHLLFDGTEQLSGNTIYAFGDGSGDGVKIQDCSSPDVNIETAQCGGSGLILDGVQETSQISHTSIFDNRALTVTGTNQTCDRIEVTEDAIEADLGSIEILDGGAGTHEALTLKGSSNGANQSTTAGEADVTVDDANHDVTLEGFNMASPNTDNEIDAPSQNLVKVYRGRWPTGWSVTNRPLIIDEVTNVATENSGRNGGAIGVGSGDSTGRVAEEITHGLDFAPNDDQIDVNLTNPTTNDYAAYIRDIQAPDSTSFIVSVWVDQLSGASGDTVSVSWSVDASQR